MKGELKRFNLCSYFVGEPFAVSDLNYFKSTALKFWLKILHLYLIDWKLTTHLSYLIGDICYTAKSSLKYCLSNVTLYVNLNFIFCCCLSPMSYSWKQNAMRWQLKPSTHNKWRKTPQLLFFSFVSVVQRQQKNKCTHTVRKRNSILKTWLCLLEYRDKVDFFTMLFLTISFASFFHQELCNIEKAFGRS